MGHSYAIDPLTYCRVTSRPRSHVYEDSDLVAGNVEFYLEWFGGYIEPWFGGAAGTVLHDRTVGTGASGLMKWFEPSLNVKVNGSNGATSTFAAKRAVQTSGGNGSVLSNRTASIDASFTVTVGTAGAGIELRGANSSNGFNVFVDKTTGRVIAQKSVSGVTTVLLSAGTIAQGGTYTVRVTADLSDNWQVWLDGVSLGTFTDAALNTQKYFSLLWFDTTSVLSGVSFQPTGPCPATSYEVVNDAGEVVASGAVSGYKVVVPDTALVQRNGLGPYGGYKLRLHGASVGNYGTAKGNCEFVRVPTDANFAAKPEAFTATGTPGNSSSWDVGLRSFFGLGATRLPYDDGVIAAIASYLKSNYVDRALSARPRHLIGHFQSDNTGQAAAITALAAANASTIDAWEPRNEPQGGSASAFVTEQQYFYNAVKAGSPTAKVLGPNPVTYSPQPGGLPWITAFLAAGGAAYLDGLSVHGYNDTEGDIEMARRQLAALKSVADQYGLSMWQTEQSHFSQYINLYFPASNALPWTSVQLMVQETGGIPIERNVLWYDIAHGFSHSSLWENGTGVTSVPVLVRTMVAELGNRTFDSEYDLGDNADFYVCGKWTGADGSATVGVLAQSRGLPDIRFYLTGTSSVAAVDGYGNEFTLTRGAQNIITVPSNDIPTWVRLPVGSDLILVAADWDVGTNRALTATTTTSSVTGVSNVAHLTDGALHNDGFQQSYFTINDYPYDGSPYATHTITVDLGAVAPTGKIVLAAPRPWQTSCSTPIDFDIDISTNGSSWTTVFTQSPPASTTASFVSDLTGSNTLIDTWFSPEQTWIVDAGGASARYVRLVIRDISYGGHETQASSEAIWGTNVYEKRLDLRSLRVYEYVATAGLDRPRFNLTLTAT